MPMCNSLYAFHICQKPVPRHVRSLDPHPTNHPVLQLTSSIVQLSASYLPAHPLSLTSFIRRWG
jgi:hypothetical protein